MSLNIKSHEAEQLIRELAEITGESLTQVVTVAVKQRLEREKRVRSRKGLAAELRATALRCAAGIKRPLHSLDHGDLLYDERGLPR
ncbi:MAG: type II toxin-antitoxin system VapB family antitoxin [Bryobacteraceae bacterium]